MDDYGDYFVLNGIKIWKNRILEIPQSVVGGVIRTLNTFGQNVTDYSTFHFRPTIRPYIPVWITVYCLLFVTGIISNVKFLKFVNCKSKHLCNSHSFLLKLFCGNSLNDLLIKNTIVLPVSFIILTSVHWVLGRNFCRFFPILQDSCFYSSSLILLAAFYFRYHHVSDATFQESLGKVEYDEKKKTIGPVTTLLICFSIGVCAIIPHTVYFKFVDFGYYFGENFSGSGVCVLNIENRIIDYIKYLFILFYIIPVFLSLSFYFKTVDIIEKWKESEEEEMKRVVRRKSVDLENQRRKSLLHPEGEPSDRRLSSYQTSFVEVDTGNMETNGKDPFIRNDRERRSVRFNSDSNNERSMGDNDHIPGAPSGSNGKKTGRIQGRRERAQSMCTSPQNEPLNSLSVGAASSSKRNSCMDPNTSQGGGNHLRTITRTQQDGSSAQTSVLKGGPKCPYIGGSDNDDENDGPFPGCHNKRGKKPSAASLESIKRRKKQFSSDLASEMLLQKIMGHILFFHSLLLLPFNILRFARQLMVETPDLMLTFDLIFLTFVGIQFSSTLVIPSVFLHFLEPEYRDRRGSSLGDIHNMATSQEEDHDNYSIEDDSPSTNDGESRDINTTTKGTILLQQTTHYRNQDTQGSCSSSSITGNRMSHPEIARNRSPSSCSAYLQQHRVQPPVTHPVSTSSAQRLGYDVNQDRRPSSSCHVVTGEEHEMQYIPVSTQVMTEVSWNLNNTSPSSPLIMPQMQSPAILNMPHHQMQPAYLYQPQPKLQQQQQQQLLPGPQLLLQQQQQLLPGPQPQMAHGHRNSLMHVSSPLMSQQGMVPSTIQSSQAGFNPRIRGSLSPTPSFRSTASPSMRGIGSPTQFHYNS